MFFTAWTGRRLEQSGAMESLDQVVYYFLFSLVFGGWAAGIAVRKGRNGAFWLILGLVFSFLAVIVISIYKEE